MKPVVIIGAGALGSHVVLFGRNWQTPIRLVDFDRVEMKNAQSQFHTRMGVGRNKVQAMQQAMQGMWAVRLNGVPHKLTPDNAAQLLGDAALVLDCTDNVEARNVIQKYVRENDIPCLHGALSGDGSFGRIVWDEDFAPDPEGEPGQATCEDADNLAFYALCGAQLALIAQRFLATGEKSSFQVMPTALIRLA